MPSLAEKLLLPPEEAEALMQVPSEAQQKAAKARATPLWAKVPLEHLLNRQLDDLLYPARTRVLLFLMIKSRRGKQPVVFTNAMAAMIGVSRWQKNRHLKTLVSLGLVTVAWSGHASPVVTVVA